MAKDDNSLYVPFFLDDDEAMSELDDAERGRLFSACIAYAKTGVAPKLAGNERFLFPMFRQRIDRFMASYEERREKNRANARKRYEPQEVASEDCESDEEIEVASDGMRTDAMACERMPTKTKAKTEAKEKAKTETKANSSPPLSPPRADAQGGNPEKAKTAFALLNELAPEYGLSATLKDKLREWLEYKKERHEGYKPQGLKALVAMAKKNADDYGEQKVLDLIDSAMANRYMGITWDRIGAFKAKATAPPNNKQPPVTIAELESILAKV